MSTYYAKSSLAMDRQLKVQRLVIPLKVVHNATPASVSLQNDEPSVLFLQSQGVNQIDASDAAQFANTSPSDASGQLNLLVNVGESVAKVMRCALRGRFSGTDYAAHLDTGSTQGVSSNGNIMLSVSTSVNFSTTDLDACLDVEYSVSDGN